MKKAIRNTILTLLFLASISGIAYSTYKFHEINERYRQVEKTSSEVQSIISEANKMELKTSTGETLEERPYFTSKAYKALKEVNPDFKAFLHFTSDKIAEPVLQANDNSYYLHLDIHEDYDRMGSVFFDYRTTLDDNNILIYGHETSYDNRAKFAYFNVIHGNQDLYEENAHFDLYLENEVRHYEIEYIAENFFEINHQIPNLDEDNFNKYISFLSRNSSITPLQDIKWGDNILTIQTCLRRDNSIKLLLVAKEISREPYAGIAQTTESRTS